MKTIFDGVNVVQIAGLGVLALLPLVTYALMGFACGNSHRWDFVEGLVKAIAALTFTLNVCVAAWYVMKFHQSPTGTTIVVAVLALVWYFHLWCSDAGAVPSRQAGASNVEQQDSGQVDSCPKLSAPSELRFPGGFLISPYFTKI